MFAINIAVQTNMWNVLHHLVICRGLGPQVLDVLVKALPTFMSKNSNLIPHQNSCKKNFCDTKLFVQCFSCNLIDFRWFINVFE